MMDLNELLVERPDWKARDRRWRVLFVCTGNSCRSQMAEAWANTLLGNFVVARSAGIVTHGLDPLAVKVMAEVGVDMAYNRSKQVVELCPAEFDDVITLSDRAKAQLPVIWRSVRVVHVGFEAPSKSTLAASWPDELEAYRFVRDEIRAFVEILTPLPGYSM